MNKKMSTWLVFAFWMAILILLASCGQPTTPGSVEDQIAEILEGDVNRFQIVEIDIQAVQETIAGGSIVLPLANEDNKIIEMDLSIMSVQLRAPGLAEGFLRDAEGEVEAVELPPEQNFRIGECSINPKEFSNCGSLTFLDADQTMFSGMLIDAELGITFFEPVESYVAQEKPGLLLVYHITGTEGFDFGDCVGSEAGMIRPVPSKTPGLAALRNAFVLKETSIVLDGDVQFYNINTSTVWARQEEAFNAVSVLYGIVEPLSAESPNTDTWGLTLDIKGQEVWISGGPTTTNGDALINELKDPSYWLLNPVNDDELHYFFVGYNVSGLYGQAAGIGSTSGFGGASGKNHAFGEARSTQSLKTRWVIMAHEVGHLLGGRHGDGILSGCTTFIIWDICGDSIMLAGSAGGPETRATFFSDANDSNIADVIDAVLP